MVTTSNNAERKASSTGLGGLLKRAIKEGFLPEGLVTPVLTPQVASKVLPEVKYSVASPFIIRDPDTFQPYILFTGWDDPNGLARRIYIAPMNEGLEVDLGKVKRIADGDLFNVTGLNTVHAMWDAYNEQWIVSATAYGAPSNDSGYFIFYDKNFNIVGKQVLTFGGVDLGDAGLSMIPLNNREIWVTAGFGRWRSLFYIPNGSARPMRGPAMINTVGASFMRMAPYIFSDALDVHQAFILNGMFVMLSELLEHTKIWRVHVFFGAERNWIVDSSRIPFMYVAPMTTPFPIHFTEVVGSIGHPHFTDLLGEPLLFFSRFTGEFWSKAQYICDIWAVRINPSDVFNPYGKTLVTGGENEPNVIPGRFPIPTFGARRAVIYLFNVTGAGVLTLYESTSPYHIYHRTAIRAMTTYSVSSGSNKVIVENPAPWISLGLNVDLSEWMVVLQT